MCDNREKIVWQLWLLEAELEGLDKALEGIVDASTDLEAASTGELSTAIMHGISQNLFSLLASSTEQESSDSGPLSPPRPTIRRNERAATNWVPKFVRGQSIDHIRYEHSARSNNGDACPYGYGTCPGDPCPMPCADLQRRDNLFSPGSGNVPRMGE